MHQLSIKMFSCWNKTWSHHRFHNNLFFHFTNLTCFHGNIWHFLFSLDSIVKIGKQLSEAFLEDLPKRSWSMNELLSCLQLPIRHSGTFIEYIVLCWVVIKLTAMAIRKLQTVWKKIATISFWLRIREFLPPFQLAYWQMLH